MAGQGGLTSDVRPMSHRLGVINEPQLDQRLMRLLDRINVPCQDDGSRFLDRSRLEAIDACIASMPEPWTKVHEGPLATVYGGARAPRTGDC